MKFRHIEYFVAAAEELNFTHAAGRLHVSQPPFSKQIHDLEGELGIDLFARQRKGVTLTPAGKSFLIDARRILEDCEASIRKAQRISRGEIGELAIGYMSAATSTKILEGFWAGGEWQRFRFPKVPNGVSAV
jgi:DNA-binding transcriptional LysR family regulator